MRRYLYEFIEKDLHNKAVLLSGPRQIGKTTLARSFYEQNAEYLNYDIITDRKVILAQAWQKDRAIIVLDEIHKFKKWKNFLKGVIDQYQNKPPLLVTGSARLEVFRKAGDALTGRTFLYHLHPIDIAEASVLAPNKTASELLDALIKSGGFPESFYKPENAQRFLIDRLSTVLRDDVRDLAHVTQIKTLELLVELLRERVSGQINYANLASDLSISPPTVKNWIDLLEKLYLVFLIRPFASSSAKSIRKETKFYFYDNIAATNGEAAILENIVALALLKWCELEKDSKGRNLQLQYYRDSNNREVDFVITENRKAFACIEVKTSEDAPTAALKYLTERVNPRYSIQLVKNIDKARDYGAIKIRPLAKWLKDISRELA